MALTFRSFGTLRSNPPGGVFDKMSSECIGVVGIVKGEVSVTGNCEYVTTMATGSLAGLPKPLAKQLGNGSA